MMREDMDINLKLNWSVFWYMGRLKVPWVPRMPNEINPYAWAIDLWYMNILSHIVIVYVYVYIFSYVCRFFTPTMYNHLSRYTHIYLYIVNT